MIHYMTKKGEPMNEGIIWDDGQNVFFHVNDAGIKKKIGEEDVMVLPKQQSPDYKMTEELYTTGEGVRPSDGIKYFEALKWTGYKEI